MSTHPIIRRYRILFACGVAFALLAPVTGLFSPLGSIAVLCLGVFCFGSAQTTVLYRAGWAPGGLNLAHLRRLRIIVGLVATPLLLASWLVTLAAWSIGFSNH